MAQALSNLPIGAKVKFGKYSVNGEAAEPIIWIVAAKNHSTIPAYPANAITLLTQKIIDLRCVDASEPDNANQSRQVYGNNRYSVSNIDQWLNKDSAARSWYTAQHSADHDPSGDRRVYAGTDYTLRPAFLNAFTTLEKGAILPTTIRVAKPQVDGAGYEDISRKVFLPSWTEISGDDENDINEGSVWSYFSSGSRIAYLTSQAFNHSVSTSKPASVGDAWTWWLRTADTTGSSHMYTIYSSGVRNPQSPYYGQYGIRPALNLSSSIRVSDAVDGDGCYTIVWNTAPTSPTVLNVPTIYGGKSNSIYWSSATDADGDTVTYQLECSLNGAAYAQIYSGTSTTYAHLVPFGTTSVAYRVKATDAQGESSTYATSATKTVINNNAPVISGTDGNLGVKNSGFTGTYTVTDANNNGVTVTEAVDGVQIRSLVATLGQEITYGITGNTWLALPNGSHTLTIRATDGIDSAVRTYTFTKLVDKFSIQNAIPWMPMEMPTRIMLVITRNLPATAVFKVEVCNNAYDVSPVWEDCTNAVKNGLVYNFTNKTKTGVAWAVQVRVTVERNGAMGACYVSAIGGNFE